MIGRRILLSRSISTWITMGKRQKFKTYIKNFYALFVFPDGHKGNFSFLKSGNPRLLFIKNAILYANTWFIYLLINYLHIKIINNVKFNHHSSLLVFTFHSSFFFFHFSLIFAPLSIRPGAEIGRQACLRGMCPIGCEGSSPSPGTLRVTNNE